MSVAVVLALRVERDVVDERRPGTRFGRMIALFIILMLLLILIPIIVAAFLMIGVVWIATALIVAFLKFLASIRVERR